MKCDDLLPHSSLRWPTLKNIWKNQILFKFPEAQRLRPSALSDTFSEEVRKLCVFCSYVLEADMRVTVIWSWVIFLTNLFSFVTQKSLLFSSIMSNEKYIYTETIAEDLVGKLPELTTHFYMLGF